MMESTPRFFRVLAFQTGQPVTNTEATAASLATAVILSAAATSIPAPLVLPVVSIAAVVTALLIASFAWLRTSKQKTDGINSWDVAGGLIFVGFAAALLSNPEAALPLFEQASN